MKALTVILLTVIIILVIVLALLWGRSTVSGGGGPAHPDSTLIQRTINAYKSSGKNPPGVLAAIASREDIIKTLQDTATLCTNNDHPDACPTAQQKAASDELNNALSANRNLFKICLGDSTYSAEEELKKLRHSVDKFFADVKASGLHEGWFHYLYDDKEQTIPKIDIGELTVEDVYNTALQVCQNKLEHCRYSTANTEAPNSRPIRKKWWSWFK